MKKYIILILILLLATEAFGGIKDAIVARNRVAPAAGIAVNNVSESGYPQSGVLTWSHTCAGSDRYLFVGVIGNAAGPVASVTYNDVAMTKLFEDTAASTYYTSGWGLVAPDTGTHDIVVTLAAHYVNTLGGAISLTGVNQTTATGTAVTAKAFGTTPTVNVSSASGELVIDVVAGDTLSAVGEDQTSRVIKQTFNSVRYIGMSTEPGSSTTTMSWTAGSAWWAIGAIGVKPK